MKPAHELIRRAEAAGVRRGDVVLIVLLLVLSVVLMCFSLCSAKDDAAMVRVCVDGRQEALLPLGTDTVYEVAGGCANIVEITGGRVRIRSAGCPDESCVAQGFISRTGECIVCLPGRVTVTILSADSDGTLDTVAY